MFGYSGVRANNASPTYYAGQAIYPIANQLNGGTIQPSVLRLGGVAPTVTCDYAASSGPSYRLLGNSQPFATPVYFAAPSSNIDGFRTQVDSPSTTAPQQVVVQTPLQIEVSASAPGIAPTIAPSPGGSVYDDGGSYYAGSVQKPINVIYVDRNMHAVPSASTSTGVVQDESALAVLPVLVPTSTWGTFSSGASVSIGSQPVSSNSIFIGSVEKSLNPAVATSGIPSEVSSTSFVPVPSPKFETSAVGISSPPWNVSTVSQASSEITFIPAPRNLVISSTSTPLVAAFSPSQEVPVMAAPTAKQAPNSEALPSKAQTTEPSTQVFSSDALAAVGRKRREAPEAKKMCGCWP